MVVVVVVVVVVDVVVVVVIGLMWVLQRLSLQHPPTKAL